MVAAIRLLAASRHLRALKSIKCAIDIQPPGQYPHLARKLKTKKLQEDRAAEIQLENRQDAKLS